jgi:hypothetical protein
MASGFVEKLCEKPMASRFLRDGPARVKHFIFVTSWVNSRSRIGSTSSRLRRWAFFHGPNLSASGPISDGTIPIKFVVILEDSDAALMTRGSDNREQVSAILNLSDGMLADFLRLQIICTINCSAADIDPALLRPGRLLCHRVFGRLDYTQATRLAESLGRKLPQARDYSLAEVFAGHDYRQN